MFKHTQKFALPRWTTRLFLAGAILVFSGCTKQQGAPKYPVTGTVLINGTAVEGVVVRLYATDDSLQGKDRSPVGVTDENGVFELATFDRKDGAPKGVFLATFRWPTDLYAPSAQDILEGKYSNRKTSGFSISIKEHDNSLPPFELKIPPARFKQAMTAMSKMRADKSSQ